MIAEQVKDLQLVFEPIQEDSHRCGCYANNFPLPKPKQHHIVLVPLTSSHYHLEIVNSISNVTLTQTYHNPTNQFLEVHYSFPIHPEACIYRFVADYGQTRIEGVVKQKEQARKEYQKAIKEGKKAAYGEVRQQSRDIMNLKVGNIGPKESVKIEISYLQELSLSCNTFYQLHLMGTISPRYMRYIPEEMIKAGLRNEGAKASGRFYWNFTISLKTSRKAIFFDSNSHDIQLVSQNDPQTQTQLVMTKQSLPNKDFYFTYTTEDYHLPSFVLGKTDAASTAMISFIPKFCSLSLDDAYKASVAGKGFETELEHAKGQYVFLLDRSGSMGGKRIEKAKEALILFIKSLPEDTYFNVVSFGTASQQLFPHSLKYSDKQVDSAVAKIKKMTANLGGTQIYEVLQRLLSQKPIEDYPRQIFLLTDGGVSDTQEVIRMVGANNKYSRVHTIGVGNGCSEDLVLGCAKKGKGQHVFIVDEENPSEKIIQLLSDSLSPVITSIKLQYNPELVESIIPNPDRMPFILKGDLVNFYITFKGQLQSPAHFSFNYRDTVNQLPYQSDILIDANSSSDPFIDRMGHFKRIRLMEDSQSEGHNLEDLMFFVKKIDTKQEIIEESIKHQILSIHTAFVCIEKQLIDGSYQQVKDKGRFTVQIPNLLPEQYEKPAQKQMMRRSAPRSRGSGMVKMAKAPLPQKKMASSKPAALSFALKRQKIMDESSFLPMKKCVRKETEKQKHNFLSFSRGDQEQQELSFEKEEVCLEKEEDSGEDDEIMFDLQPKLIQPESNPIYEQRTYFQTNPILASKIEEEKAAACKTIPMGVVPQMPITAVIGCQSTEGCWKDIELIGKLFSKEVQEKVAISQAVVIGITYLICKWIERHYPEKQYSLVVKKGYNFIKKQGQNLEVLSKLYEEVI